MVRPRSSVNSGFESYKLENDENAYVYTGGFILTVTEPATNKNLIDIEGDRLIVWKKGDPQGAVDRMRGPQGETTGAMEFYIAGHVEMRYQGPKGQMETLLADEVY